jgi:ATP-binding cassette, subfamily B, bacterial
MGKFKFFKQLESIDCGATCLKMVAHYYGKEIDIKYLRNITYTNKNGVNLNSLISASNALNIDTLPVKLTFEELIVGVPLPAILHWKNTHYIVVEKVVKKRKHLFSLNEETIVTIADPGFGRLKLRQEEFENLWHIDQDGKGVALLLEPNDNFTTEKIFIETTNHVKFFRENILPFKVKIVKAFLLVLIIACLNFIYPYLNQRLIDEGVSNRNAYFIILILLSQFVVYTTSSIMNILQGWLFLNIKINFGLQILANFLLKLIKMPMSFFENKLSSDILLRIEDHDKIEDFFSRNSVQFLISSISFLVFSIVLATYSSLLGVIFFAGSVVSILWVLWFHKKRRYINYNRFEIEAINKNMLYEIVNGISDIKINNAEKTKINDWKHNQSTLYELNKKSLKLENYQDFGVNYITQIKNTVLIGIAGFMVINSKISLGEMLSISFILGQLNAPLEFFVMFVYSFQDANISLERLSDIYIKKDESEIVKNNDTVILNEEIVFNDVVFGYNNPNDYKVFNDLSLTIKLNETTAIVGTSGSGKTTLIKLLMKFHQPMQGQITIDHKDLNDINFDKWREKISVVFQDGYIFSETLKNNIIMSQPYDEKFFNTIIEKTNVSEFIPRLPQKEDTKIGENGLDLSKGQKQRILIARAMYKNPDILILDEATSALDSENEKIIHENLQTFFKGKTVLIIAHRLSTVKNADQIIVLKNGKIVEQGNHASLVNSKKEYYNLVKNQLELGN